MQPSVPRYYGRTAADVVQSLPPTGGRLGSVLPLQDKNYCAIVPPRCSSISNKRAAGPLLFRRRYTDARRHRDGCATLSRDTRGDRYATPPRRIRDGSVSAPPEIRLMDATSIQSKATPSHRGNSPVPAPKYRSRLGSVWTRQVSKRHSPRFPSGVQGAQPPPGVQRLPLFLKTLEGGAGGIAAQAKPDHSLKKGAGQSKTTCPLPEYAARARRNQIITRRQRPVCGRR